MKIKLLSILVASAIAGAATPAFALDDAAILKRLEKLENQRKADQTEIDALRSKVQQLESQKGNAVSSDEASKLREEIVKVDQKATSRIESAKKTIEGERDKLKVNGYMSVYGVKANNKAVTLASGVDNHTGFNSDTIAGIQFDYKLDDQLNAVVQLQAEGKNNYELNTPWAFLRYKLTPTTTVRAGRMVLPLYLYADSIDVGYTYPWVRPPIEMYGTASQRFTGVDLTQNFSFAGTNNSVQVLFGDGDGTQYKSDYLAGLFVTFNYDAWTLRAGELYIDNLAVPGLPLSDSIAYQSASLRYDNGGLLWLTEARHINTGKNLELYVPDSDGFYTTLGYQIDKFMPYGTFGKSYTVGELPGTSSPVSQQSLGLGLRYNLTDKVVIKGEATKYDHFDGTAGVTATLPGVNGVLNPANLPTLNKLDKDGATVMSLGLDAIF